MALAPVPATAGEKEAGSDPPPGVARGWSDGVAQNEIVPPYMGGGLEMAVIPTPKIAAYSGKLFEVGKAAIVIPKDYPHKSTLRDLKQILPEAAIVESDAWKEDADVRLLVAIGNGEINPVAKGAIETAGTAVSEDDRRKLGKEGYLLFVTRASGGRVVAVLAGNAPAGDFWAVQTLRQLLAEKDGKRYIQGIWTLDWPTFPARGSKGMRNCMPEYKDNFSWSGGSRELIGNFGWYVPNWAPGAELDCSDGYLAEVEQWMAREYQAGARAFGIKFDDVGAALKAGCGLLSWEVKDLPSLLAKLAKDGAGDAPHPCRRFWACLPEAMRGRIQGYLTGKETIGKVGNDALTALGRTLSAPELYAKEDFAGVSLPAEAQDLMKKDRAALSTRELQRLNRLLLETAFPGDIAKSPKEDTAERFKTYGEAICYFMRELDKRAKKLDPSCRLYYLPHAYGAKTGGKEAEGIVAAGGFPKDTALCWTGPFVFSKVLEPEAMRLYMDSFGLGHNKGLIYDNYARHGDYFPIPREGRSPELVKHLDGVFSENSTRLNRMTRCDQNWNPEAYDPQRAFKLACREAARRDPKTYKAMYDFLEFYEANRVPPLRLCRAERLENLKKGNGRMVELLRPLREILPAADPMLKDVTGTVDKRLEKMERVFALGYREARAVRAQTPPKLDGKLDDACWQDAPAITGFVSWGDKNMANPIPDERQTIVRMAYDDKNLYVGVLCRASDPGEFAVKKPDGSLKWWAKREQTEPDMHGTWYCPSVEFFFGQSDVLTEYYHFIPDMLGHKFDAYSGQPPHIWNSGWTVKTIPAEKECTYEMAIPLESMGVERIRKGDVWRANLYRGHTIGPKGDESQMWSYVTWDFAAPEDFGTLTFE